MRVEQATAVIEPVVDSLGLELYDAILDGRTLRVTVDRDGGVDLDSVTDATRALSSALDASELDAGAYALEVSSPGLERTLRTPAHFTRAVGSRVSAKARDAQGAAVRHVGTLTAADELGFTVEVDGAPGPIQIPYDQTIQVRTVFEWGPAPKPGARRGKKKKVAT
jgi:ribosome maturation factor RimP